LQLVHFISFVLHIEFSIRTLHVLKDQKDQRSALIKINTYFFFFTRLKQMADSEAEDHMDEEDDFVVLDARTKLDVLLKKRQTFTRYATGK